MPNPAAQHESISPIVASALARTVRTYAWTVKDPLRVFETDLEVEREGSRVIALRYAGIDIYPQLTAAQREQVGAAVAESLIARSLEGGE